MLNPKQIALIFISTLSIISVVSTIFLFTTMSKDINNEIIQGANVSLSDNTKTITNAFNNSTELITIYNKQETKLLANSVVENNIVQLSVKSDKLQEVKKDNIKQEVIKQEKIEQLKREEKERKEKEKQRIKEKEEKRLKEEKKRIELAKKKEAESKTSAPKGKKTFTMESTAYGPDCVGCSGITASGINVKDNPHQKIVAVDPKVIPLGTKVWVEGYGEALAADTGGAIKGHKIDVLYPSEAEAKYWGRKNVTVKILD